nr:MAG TPA: hypothetical protein [Caudoviricetes sp.]DAV60263.1 MAG TPA: hypothetical protein [Caudoviricetes sp.]
MIEYPFSVIAYRKIPIFSGRSNDEISIPLYL